MALEERAGPARETVCERFALSVARDRWPDLVCFDHAALPGPIDFGREGDDLVVVRRAPPLRRVRDGRIPKRVAPSLFLQASGLLACLQAAGAWADADDLLDAGWELVSGAARLVLSRTPSSVARGGLPVAPSTALAVLLDRLARSSDAALPLAGLLASADAPRRRADFWVAAAYRLFPAAGAPAGASAERIRTAGSLGLATRRLEDRALVEKARALLDGRACRILSLEDGSAALVPGSAIGLKGASLAEAVAFLRSGSRAAAARPLWIAAGPDRWDALSRAALASAALPARRDGETTPEWPGADVVDVPVTLPVPKTPDVWRRELLVPCGTVRGTLRFCERLAELAAEDGDTAAAVRSRGLAMVAHPDWPAFVSDPTGDGALPPAPRAGASPDESRFALAAPGRGEPAEIEIARALDAGNPEAALEAARRWRESEPDAPTERWFELAARLAARCPQPWPPWLDLVQAERETSGGRAAEARAALERVAGSPDASTEDRRAARLRLAELAVDAGRWGEAADAAEAWRQMHPDGPGGELARALRIEAAAASRSGDSAGALARLDAAAEALRGEPAAPRALFEILLARAAVLSRAGRLEEEARVYDGARALLGALAASGTGGEPDGVLAARLLATEALSLSDRREFDLAVARLEEARAILRHDPVESARIAIDLAAALYHGKRNGGRLDRCIALLEEAAALAAAAGREDLARLALANRVEAAIASEDWSAAESGVRTLEASARRDRDETWTLVALHARGRLALRRGRLDEAGSANAAALELAARLGDRLEAGELRLEAGDLAALRGDAGGARREWAEAAEDPPDRCDTDVRARERLSEVEAFVDPSREDEAAERTRSAAERILRGEFAAAEAVARWSALFGDRMSRDVRDAAADLLAHRGAPALAEIARPGGSRSRLAADVSGLRALRDAVADALGGGEPLPRLPLGLAALALAPAESGEPDRLFLGEPDGEPVVRILRPGVEPWTLRLWPRSRADFDADAAALVVETLLSTRAAIPPPGSGFAEGWRRLGVVTADASMEEPYRRLERFASKSMTVLVLGESGSGKEAVARAVHTLSPRASGPFVAVNVSAIPAALVESELFGHARGAFTGADRDRAGLLEEAARGTIFFDEIGDLAGPIQSKLLRALQDREIRRVGENRSRRIDVRVVSATSRDLAREVEAGRFREDLYYRLHVAVIRLPRLAERGRDALLLARHFLDAAAREDGRGPFELAPDAVAALLAHAWPGNVRELQSAIASGAALADGRRIDARLLPDSVRRAARPSTKVGGYRSSVNAHRRDLIMEALERAGGNRSRAARDLRLSRQALLYLIRELGVPERRSRPGAPQR